MRAASCRTWPRGSSAQKRHGPSSCAFFRGPAWADALVREVRTAPVLEGAPRPRRRRSSRRESSPNGGGKSGLDALLDMVDVSSDTEPTPPSARPEPARSDMARVVEAVARSARPEPAARARGGKRPAAAGAGIPEPPRGHPFITPRSRRLEASWRGLPASRRALRVGKRGSRSTWWSAGRDAVTDALRRLGEADPERAAIDLVVIDQHIGPVAVDLASLETWAGLASALLAPIVLAGRPTMLGLDSLEQVARSTSALSASDDGRAIALRSVAAREASRWVAIVLNDPLVRAAYTQASARLEQPPFEEDASDPEAHVFANGAYVIAALCARSHARLRWPTAITGGRDGVLGNLAVHTVRDRGEEAAVPLQVVPTEDAVREVARAGLTLLTCAPNTDAVVLSRAPVLYRGAQATVRPAPRSAISFSSAASPAP